MPIKWTLRGLGTRVRQFDFFEFLLKRVLSHVSVAVSSLLVVVQTDLRVLKVVTKRPHLARNFGVLAGNDLDWALVSGCSFVFLGK